MDMNLASFTDILSDEIPDSQPLSLSSVDNNFQRTQYTVEPTVISTYVEPIKITTSRPLKHTGQHGEFRSIEEIEHKYREIFTYPFFNLVQSRVIEDALYSDKSMVVCAPTGSGKTVVFEMAIVQLLMEIEDKQYDRDFKIIYMAPVKALCTERLTEWYSKFTKLGLLCIEVTGDTDVDFSHLKPYRVIITTPEKWDMLTRRWRDHRGLVELIKLFLIDEVHILNDETRGPVLEAVVSRMKTIESSTQSEYRIEQLQRQYQGSQGNLPLVDSPPPRIRFVAVSATVSNPEDVAAWLGNADKPAVYYKFGDECRPVKLKRVVEGYPCPDGTSIFKFDIILNYKLWPVIQKYHNGKPTLIFCNTRKSVTLTAEALSREITISFNPEQRAKLTALASTIKNKKLQSLILAGVGCHHAGLLFEERINIETAFRNRDLPILITTTTLAMGVNLPAHLVIIKNTQQYVKGAYQEYSISTVLQMVGRAGRPQFDTEATAVIMTRTNDKHRYEALVCGSDPLQSYLHKRLPENLNSEAALGTVKDVAQCVQWLRSTFLYVRAAKDPKRYLGLPNNAPHHLISKKIEELCVRAMNGLASTGLITMDEASCIESTEAGRLMSIFYLDLETMKHIMKIDGTATLEQVLWVVCESHELADMHLRVDERRCLNSLNRNSAAATIRYPMKGKISTRQMKLNCVIQAVLGCLPIPDPSVNQEAMKIMRIADRVCKCLVAYVTSPDLTSGQPIFFSAILNSLILAKCIAAHLWENSPYVSKQLKGIGPTFSTLLASAGKVNFMLLEESHPRDLERIMNKGPPAGNVLRKQIGFLPKYQITMTPVDEKAVTLQLSLLNHNYMAENMDNLTAGERHKSYILAGDSKNHLLLLKSFMDKDLIGMYDGTMTHEIQRKHSFEHKIIIYCISSTFVGIDAQCEYVFKDLEPAPMPLNTTNSCYFNKDASSSKTVQKQTYITDVYKERKRKNVCDSSQICQSKEKKKREGALADKIRLLKESFERTSKNFKNELQETAKMSNRIVNNILNLNGNVSSDNNNKIEQIEIEKIDGRDTKDFSEYNKNNQHEEVRHDDFENDEYMDDTKIDDILKDIESEISNGDKTKDMYKSHYDTRIHPISKSEIKIAKKSKKSNFNFLDILDKNFDFGEVENNKTIEDSGGFSNTIKSHINKYLQERHDSTNTDNKLIENLTENQSSIVMDKSNDSDRDDFMPLVVFNSKCDQPATTPVLIEPDIQEDTKSDKNDFALISMPMLTNLKEGQSSISKDKDFILHSPKTKHNEIPNVNHTRALTKTYTDTILLQNSNINALVPLGEPDNNTIEFENCRQLDYNNIVNTEINNTTPNEKDEYHRIDTNQNVEEVIHAESKCRVRKISYSAMNVDTFSRHLADRHVQIIKKIKVDLDVTEIVTKHDGFDDTVYSKNGDVPVTKSDKNSRYNQLIEPIQIRLAPEAPENTRNSDNLISIFQEIQERSNINQNVKVSEIDDEKLSTVRKISDTAYLKSTINVSQGVKNPMTSFTSRNQTISDAKNETNSSYCVTNEENANTNIKNHISVINQNLPEVITAGRKQTYSQNVVIQKHKTGGRGPVLNIREDSKNIKHENTLGSILLKYSEVFRKNIKGEHIENTKTPQTDEVNKNVKINKRPFKITDIDKIRPKLPDLLNSDTQIHITPYQRIIVDKNESVPQTPTVIYNEVPNNNNIEVIGNIIPVPEDEVTRPSHDILLSNNYKIDDAMFNPKTLIECLLKEAPEAALEVIPPPPEFSDIINYSQSQSVDNVHPESLFKTSEFDFYADTPKHNYADFEEYFQNNSINEIEPLLLSNEDYTEKSPWTITHSSEFRNENSNNIAIRRENLNKFKISSKNKFKFK